MATGVVKHTMTPDMFVKAHIKAWGKMEFCCSCRGLVYVGTCNGCGEEKGRIYTIRNARDPRIVTLVPPYLRKIGLMEEPERRLWGDTSTSTVGSYTIRFR